MASLVEELVDILEEEQKIYQSLVESGQAKRQILIDGDVPALERITIQEQEASTDLLAYSNKQIQLLKDIATVLGKNQDGITVTKLIGYLESQQEIRDKLTVARDNLIHAAAEVNRLNQTNEMLIRQALELTEFDLTLFKSLRQAPETANYDRNAYNTGTLLANSGFDAKQ